MSSLIVRRVAEAPRPAAAPLLGAQWLRSPNMLAYAAIALAVAVRAAHVLSADFPLNDGGLFYLMTQELQATHFRLPVSTTYNAAQIPFAYSPAGFYLAALINSATGVPLIQLFRFLPLAAASLLVVAVYHLARAMLRDRAAATAAVLAFALVPRSYVWLIMGGGLTRSLGLLAAVLAIHQAYLLYTRRAWRYAPTMALACALTVLSHIGTAPFLVWSIALLFLFHGRHWHALASSALVAAATVVLTAPWWATVIAQHGLEPFLAAQNTAGSAFKDLDTLYTVGTRLARFNMQSTGEPLFPLFGFFALLGAFASLRPGRVMLVLWWMLPIFTDVRAGETYATIPGALLAGIGITVVFVPLLRSLYAVGTPPGRPAGAEPSRPTRRIAAAWLRVAPPAVLGALLLFGIAGTLSRSPNIGDAQNRYLVALRPEERALMQRLSRETPASSRFLLVTGQPWFADRVAEWFPVLANRTSVNTVQGTEWVPGSFFKAVGENIAIQSQCGEANAACLTGWVETTGRPFTHVYIARAPRTPCCEPLRAALRADPAYAVVYDGPAGLVVERRTGATASR